MKLKFEKNENGEISVKVGDKSFSTQDYIQMIKDIKNEEAIDAEFDENFTEEEKGNVNSMLESINNIGEEDAENEEEEVEEEINPADIPF
jgi:hypothetical protein